MKVKNLRKLSCRYHNLVKQVSYPFVSSIFSSSSSPPHPFHTTPAFSLGSQRNFQPEWFVTAAVKLKFHVWQLPSWLLLSAMAQMPSYNYSASRDGRHAEASSEHCLTPLKSPSIKFGQRCPLRSKATENSQRDRLTARLQVFDLKAHHSPQ